MDNYVKITGDDGMTYVAHTEWDCRSAKEVQAFKIAKNHRFAVFHGVFAVRLSI